MERAVIRPIHTPEHHAEAIAAIGRLMADEALDDAGLAMLETLGILVERYEMVTFPLDKPSAVGAVRFRMDQMNLTQSGLAALIGFPRSRISDFLNAKRPLSLEMIRALHERLAIPSDILIGRSQQGE